MDEYKLDDCKRLVRQSQCSEYYYSPITDSFERVLQQQWKSNTGNIKWEDVEIVIEIN